MSNETPACNCRRTRVPTTAEDALIPHTQLGHASWCASIQPPRVDAPPPKPLGQRIAAWFGRLNLWFTRNEP